MANNKKKVLIIDADLRCPVMHRIFNISNEIGLSEYLAGIQKEDKPGDHAQIVKSRYDNLSILPAGHIPPNPAELLASRRMSDLLETLSKTFDYIMIDTPPIAIMTDAAVLSEAVQGYILVVRAGKTSMGALQNVVLHLQQLGANLLGFLLNDLNVKTGSYKYSRYSKYSTRGRYEKNT
jgi:capsular exopolysaccharide synthesis family protein